MVAVLEKPQKQQVASEIRYGSAAVCAAARIDAKTINNWLSRKPSVVLLSDDERREAGERKRFSFDFRRVMQIALTAELVALGFLPRRAAECAAKFTDMSSDMKVRKPGDLFKDATTYLVIPREGEAPRVVPGKEDTTIDTLLNPEYGAPMSAAVVIRVDDIYARVRASLASAE